MRIVEKISQYQELVNELSGLSGEMAERLNHYPEMLSEAYSEYGRDFPLTAYMQDMEDEVESILAEVRNRIRDMRQKYCPEVLEEGFDRLEEEALDKDSENEVEDPVF